MAPSLIASYAVYSAAADNTTLTTPSFSPNPGEVIVVKGATWDTANGLAAPTDSASALTWTHVNTGAPGGFNGWGGVWGATVGSAPGSITISVAPATSSNTRHSIVVERWGSAKLAASPATNSTVSGSGATASTTLTTTAANSVVSWCMVDEQSNDPANSTYLSSATQDGLYDGHVGGNSVQYFAYQSAPSAGAQTFGITNTGTVKWVTVGVEILAATVVATATFTYGPSATAANQATSGAAASFGDAMTASAANQTSSATSGLSTSVNMSASAQIGQPGQQQGSWYQLLDIRRHARQEFEYYANQPPTACPNDGEPLLPGPASEPGIWFCRYDGWQYPRDWIRPEPPPGLFDGAADSPGGSWAGLP
jgi:hypothetical protein